MPGNFYGTQLERGSDPKTPPSYAAQRGEEREGKVGGVSLSIYHWPSQERNYGTVSGPEKKKEEGGFEFQHQRHFAVSGKKRTSGKEAKVQNENFHGPKRGTQGRAAIRDCFEGEGESRKSASETRPPSHPDLILKRKEKGA